MGETKLAVLCSLKLQLTVNSSLKNQLCELLTVVHLKPSAVPLSRPEKTWSPLVPLFSHVTPWPVIGKDEIH